MKKINAFGSPKNLRQFNLASARVGFNGKENDNDVKGTGNQQDYGMRIYDPRLGRFLSIDPLSDNFSWYTPYQFSGNSPIVNIDLDGLEDVSIHILKDGSEKMRIVYTAEDVKRVVEKQTVEKRITYIKDKNRSEPVSEFKGPGKGSEDKLFKELSKGMEQQILLTKGKGMGNAISEKIIPAPFKSPTPIVNAPDQDPEKSTDTETSYKYIILNIKVAGSKGSQADKVTQENLKIMKGTLEASGYDLVISEKTEYNAKLPENKVSEITPSSSGTVKVGSDGKTKEVIRDK
jgi:RHS repeat-associated protein